MNKNKTIKQSLNDFSENLDQETLKQLDKIREQALISVNNHKKTVWFKNVSWPVFGPAIAAMALFVVLYVSNINQVIEPNNESFFDDLDIIADEIDADLLEDLDFVAWLENEKILEGELL